MSLLTLTPRGFYCEAGDFFVDPWEPVDRAVITHAHGDHATWGSRAYLTSAPGVGVLRARLEPGATIRGVEYGETVAVNGTALSLHPAGHILGSSEQVPHFVRDEEPFSADHPVPVYCSLLTVHAVYFPP